MSFAKFGMLAPALLLASCATLFNGSRQEISFDTDPNGAAVMVDGEEVCKTPCSPSLSRKTEHVVAIQLPGYYPYKMTLRSHGSNWMAGSIIFGGPFFIAVDLLTGSAWYFNEEKVTRKLDKLEATAGAEPGGVRFKVVMAAEPGWVKVAELDRLPAPLR